MEYPSFGLIDQAVFEQRAAIEGEPPFRNQNHTKRVLHLVESAGDGRDVIHFFHEDGTPGQITVTAKNGVPDVLGGNCFNALLNIMRVCHAVQAEVKAVIVSSYDEKNGLFHAIQTLREKMRIKVMRISCDLISRPSRHVSGRGLKSTILFGREHMSKEAMVPFVQEVEPMFQKTQGVLVPFYFEEFKYKQYLFPTSSAVRGGNLQKMLEDHEGTIPDNVCLFLNDEELTQIDGPNLQEVQGEDLLLACRKLTGDRRDAGVFEMPLHLGRRKGGSVAYFAGKGKEYLVETSDKLLDFQNEIAERFGGEMVHNLHSEDKSTAGRGDSKPSWIIALLTSRPDPENSTADEIMEIVLGSDFCAALIHHSEDSNLLYFDEEHGADIPGLIQYAKDKLAEAKREGWIKITSGEGL